MIIIHAVQKLLNTSRIKPLLFISQPGEGQEMHSWYARLVSSTFSNKPLVMYVHNPSLLAVVCPGKSIATTLPIFHTRLEALMRRFGFKEEFIQHEMKLVKEGFVVSKTNSRSMLGSMNAMSENISLLCADYDTPESIDLDRLENVFKNWMVNDKTMPNQIRKCFDYWRSKGIAQ